MSMLVDKIIHEEIRVNNLQMKERKEENENYKSHTACSDIDKRRK